MQVRRTHLAAYTSPPAPSASRSPQVAHCCRAVMHTSATTAARSCSGSNSAVQLVGLISSTFTASTSDRTSWRGSVWDSTEKGSQSGSSCSDMLCPRWIIVAMSYELSLEYKMIELH